MPIIWLLMVRLLKRVNQNISIESFILSIMTKNATMSFNCGLPSDFGSSDPNFPWLSPKKCVALQMEGFSHSQGPVALLACVVLWSVYTILWGHNHPLSLEVALFVALFVGFSALDLLEIWMTAFLASFNYVSWSSMIMTEGVEDQKKKKSKAFAMRHFVIMRQNTKSRNCTM